MNHIRNIQSLRPPGWMLALIFVVYVIAFLRSEYLSSRTQDGSSTTAPSAKNSPSASPTPPSCLSDSDISSITGRTFSLVREEFLDSTFILECSYRGTEEKESVAPSISYALYLQPEPTTWDMKQYAVRNKPEFRFDEAQPNMFYLINPVYELQQGQFYVKNEQHFLELSYSPIKESEDQIVSVGKQLSEKILQRK